MAAFTFSGRDFSVWSTVALLGCLLISSSMIFNRSLIFFSASPLTPDTSNCMILLANRGVMQSRSVLHARSLIVLRFQKAIVKEYTIYDGDNHNSSLYIACHDYV